MGPFSAKCAQIKTSDKRQNLMSENEYGNAMTNWQLHITSTQIPGGRDNCIMIPRQLELQVRIKQVLFICYSVEEKQMTSFIAKRVNSILVNLRFKLLKYKENNKKICNTFDHNFKNIPLYIMRKVSLERYYICIIRWYPYFKNVKKWCLTRFAIKLFKYSYT